MKGVMMPGVSAGSNHVGAIETWTPHVISPSGAASAGTASSSLLRARTRARGASHRLEGVTIPHLAFERLRLVKSESGRAVAMVEGRVRSVVLHVRLPGPLHRGKREAILHVRPRSSSLAPCTATAPCRRAGIGLITNTAA